MKKRYRRRPGVVLLIVLSLLVLFTLMAVTFVVISAQYRNAAVSAARYRKTGDDPRKYFEIAISQLIRDTNTRSSLNSQSLLRDLYGTDFAKAKVGSVSSGMGGEFLSIGIPAPTSPASSDDPLGFSVLDDSFAGCVITMLDGNARGLSSRIVDYDANPGADGEWGEAGTDDNSVGGTDEMEEFLWSDTDDYVVIRCEAFRSDTRNTSTPSVGDVFLINGRPFNGTGYGYDTGTDNLDGDIFLPGPDRKWGVADTDDDGDGSIDEIDEGGWSGSDDVEVEDWAALFSHAVATRYESGLNLGGADESWDAVDFQNMYLAMVPPDLASVGEIIPSFHRPALLRYIFEELRTSGSPLPLNFGASDEFAAWAIFNNPYTATSTLSQPQKDFIVDVKRACTFRPLPEDNPNFNGTNRHSIYGNSSANLDLERPAVWDVDNDGDAVGDSIWMDIGLPVQTSPSGKLYKPLVAILCEDLDGRLNVNAHGNLEHDSILTYSSSSPKGYTLKSVTATDSAATTSPTLPRGAGVGPAEVALAPLFNASSSEHQSILEGRYASMNDSSDDLPGVKSTDDVTVGSLRTRDVPTTYATTARASYSSQPDLRGMGGIYLDHTGHPKVAGNWSGNERVDDPYEILLSMNGYGDTGYSDRPYTLAEFERLLRFDDYDSWKLPTRLIRTAPTSFSDAEVRRLLTVHSSYVPAPKHGVPREAWDRSGTTPTTDRQRLSILDLFVGKLRENGVAEADIPAQVKTLLPFELQHGELLDINRLLGNGVDDDNDGTVDERGEKTTSGGNEQTWPNGPAGFAVDFDHQNDDPQTSDARQNLARHLFCLLMGVIDEPRMDPGDLSTLPSVEGFARAMPAPETGAFALDTTLPQTAATLAANRQKVRALVSLMVRRYAQWSVNAVDFRDSDSIMTGFEYDPNPFDGWHVDGNLNTDEGSDGADNDGDGLTDELDELRGVVWGVEYPDLLLTEAKAFHDRRVKDTDLDTTGAKRLNAADTAEVDDDLDQYRIPQGSLFLEFYCPRPRRSNNPVVPGELYYVNNNAFALDLSRIAPVSTNGRRFPVWRVAISASHWGDDTATPPLSPLNRQNPTTGMPHTTSFEPGYLSTLAPADDPYQNTSPPPTLAIERQIWFTTVDPTVPAIGFTPKDAEQIFYNRSGSAAVHVRAGGYLVVGPRPETRIGSVNSTIDMPVVAPQRIVINDWSKGADGEWGIAMVDDDGVGATDDIGEAGWPGSDDQKGVTYYNAGGTPSTPANIRTALSAVIAANPPPFWTNAATTAPTGIGINVSEPLPINVVRDAMGMAVIDSGTGTPIRIYYPEPTDTFAPGLPFDSYHAYGAAPGTLPDAPFDSDVIRDSTGAAVPEAAASTRPLFADGILDTGTNNNYRTAFVQRLADPTRAFHATTNPYITIDWSPIDLTVFNGEEQNPPTGWDPMGVAAGDFDPDDPPGVTVQFKTRDRNGADYNLWAQSTRSPVSQGNTGAAGTAAYFDRNLTQTLGYLNAGFGASRRGGIDQYRGDPTSPFPWLTIHNRPYTSPMELLLVPSCSPSRLGQEFGFLDQTAGTPTDPYTIPIPDATGEGPYPHLLNFFHETTTSAGVTEPGALLYRLLDFVETPSQYAGTEKWYRPATFEGSATGGNTFRPPYNRLSRFRDPGRVNINTIFDSRVWEGITKTFPSMDPKVSTTLRDNMVLSRQGFGDATSDILAFAWTPSSGTPVYYPSRFANPFRSAFSADLMPAIEDMRKDGVDVTLFRNHPFDDTTTATLDETTQPLFAYTADTASTHDHINTERNAFFRYQAYQHLGNTLSTTSNVFAIWMTVGFFEVEENLVSGVRVTDAAHPDGYRLGIELGLDTGEVKRHRAFYIVDRSVPVAFEPDKNHNIDRAILLQRFIE